MANSLREKRVLLVGAGGLSCAAGCVLVRSGIGHLAVADDDHVEESNLHRQILYRGEDVGRAKAPLFALQLEREAAQAGFELELVAREIRVLPATAIELVTGYDLVIEGADNFASKFLIADACAIARVPAVQAGAVRWSGWALGALPGEGPCLRCIFEEVPAGDQATCAAAGVVGPVVGVLGALQAAVALRLLLGRPQAAGVLWSYDGLAGILRPRRIHRRQQCPLCSGRITDTNVSRYMPPNRAA